MLGFRNLRWENREEKRWDCKLGSAVALSILGRTSERSLNRGRSALIDAGGYPAPEGSCFLSPSVRISPSQQVNNPRASVPRTAETWRTHPMLPPSQPPPRSGWQRRVAFSLHRAWERLNIEMQKDLLYWSFPGRLWRAVSFNYLSVGALLSATGRPRAPCPRLVALTLPVPTVHSPSPTARDAGSHGASPARHHRPQRELHPSLRWVELRGLGGEGWPWGQEVTGRV